MKFASFAICLAATLIAIDAEDTIISTGEFQSTSFKWAVGVPTLEFSYYTSSSYYYNWFFEYLPRTVIEDQTCFLSVASVNDPISATFNISCDGTNTSFWIIGELDAGEYCLEVKEKNATRDKKSINISYCDNLTSRQGAPLEVKNGTSARYEQIATFSCEMNISHELSVDGIYIHHDSYHLLCQEDASWNGTVQVECHFDPTPVLLLEQAGETVLDGVVVANSLLKLNCSDAKQGYPPAILDRKYYLNGRNEQEEFEVLPDHYGSNVSCQQINQYVAYRGNISGRSDDIPLNVIFKPRNISSSYTERLYAELGAYFPITIKFKANPPLNESDLEFFFEGTPEEKNNSLNVSDVIIHTFEHIIASVNNSNFGTYTLRTVSPSKRIGDGETNFTVILNSTLYEPEPPTYATTGAVPVTFPEAALIGICIAAAFLLIALVSFLTWRIRKRYSQEDVTTKEDKENPLYGCTPGCDIQADYASVDKKKKRKPTKEEKPNPLYQTSGTNASSIEEAYGIVDQNKIGADNPVFNSDNLEVTYAAVNKPKKGKSEVPELAVYSTVDKKKKKDKDGDGLHGDA